MSRRFRLAVLALVVLAGCSSGGPTRAVASGTPAGVDAAALNATGYDRAGTTNRTLNTSVHASISGDAQLEATRPVTATTPLGSYRRGTEHGPAVAVVAAAPAVRPIENQPVVRDPLATLAPAERVNYLQSTYAVESLDRADNATASLLGNRTHVVTYDGDADDTAVVVRMVAVRDGDEFVTVVAVTPAAAGDGERFARLLAGVRH